MKNIMFGNLKIVVDSNKIVITRRKDNAICAFDIDENTLKQTSFDFIPPQKAIYRALTVFDML